MTGFFEEISGGFKLFIRAIPNARIEKIDGRTEYDGRFMLKIKISAPPEDGRANISIIKLLTKNLGLKKSDIEIIAGEKSRNKVLLVKSANLAIKAAIQNLGI